MTKMRNFIKGAFLTGALALLLASCSGSKAKTAKTSLLQVGLVTALGSVNDESFNQGAWEGLQSEQKAGLIKASYKETLQESKQVSNLELYADGETQVIIGCGFNIADALKTVANRYQNKQFIIIDYKYPAALPNVLSLTFNTYEGSFLAGYIAAKMSKTGTVGFIGGIKSNVVDGFKNGYIAGVHYASPKDKVISLYLDSFTDSAKGKSTAQNLYRQGADVLFHAAGGAGDGVIEAAKEQNKWVIGVDRDQSYLAPDNVITSVMKNVNVAVKKSVEEISKSPTLLSGSRVYGLSDGAVDVTLTSPKLPADLIAQVKELRKKLANGTLKEGQTK